MKRLELPLVVAAVVAVLLVLFVAVPLVTERGGETHLKLPAPASVEELDLSGLWGRVSQGAGFDPVGATLEDLEIAWKEDGSLYALRFRAATADGHLVQVGGSPIGGVLNLTGSSVEIDPAFARSSWSTPLSPTFEVLDGLGLRAIERFQQRYTEPEPGGLLTLGLLMRSPDGQLAEELGPQAFVYRKAGFVPWRPEEEEGLLGGDTVAFRTAVMDPVTVASGEGGEAAPGQEGVAAISGAFQTGDANAFSFYLVPAGSWPPELDPETGS